MDSLGSFYVMLAFVILAWFGHDVLWDIYKRYREREHERDVQRMKEAQHRERIKRDINHTLDVVERQLKGHR